MQSDYKAQYLCIIIECPYIDLAQKLDTRNTLNSDETVEAAFLINRSILKNSLNIFAFGTLGNYLLTNGKGKLDKSSTLSNYPNGGALLCLTNNRVLIYNKGFWNIKKVGALRTSCSVNDIKNTEISKSGLFYIVIINFKDGTSQKGSVPDECKHQLQIFAAKINGTNNEIKDL